MSLSVPLISDGQRQRLEELASLAQSLNTKINLYSTGSAQIFWQRHIEHSLTLASKSFPANSVVVDWGTGGGMPGLPLALIFPDVQFVLVDAVLKKVQSVQFMARRLGLENVEAWHGRAESWRGQAGYSVSRATAPLSTLWSWHERIAVHEAYANSTEWRPGLVCLKGGDLASEIADLRASQKGLEIITTPLTPWAEGYEFTEKVIVEVFQSPI